MKKKFNYFSGPLNQWTNDEVYRTQRRELLRQINALLDIQSALSQSSQGYPEDYKSLCELMQREQFLCKSVHIALGL